MPIVFGSDESFSCFAEFCGSDATYSVGDNTYNNSDTQYTGGNIILAESDALLRSFEVRVSSASSSCTADFYVLSNSSFRASDWTVEYANVGLTIGGSSASTSSGDINLPTIPGVYYALVMGSTCSAADLRMSYGGYSTSMAGAGFGTAVGYSYDGGYNSSYSRGDIVDLGYLSDYYLFDADVVVMGN